jgi:hypothetical protein
MILHFSFLIATLILQFASLWNYPTPSGVDGGRFNAPDKQPVKGK